MLWIGAILILATAGLCYGEIVMLLDTTNSDELNWTRYSVNTTGWQEKSYTAILRNTSDPNYRREETRRSYVVCDVGEKYVDNWLWTPFIEKGDANKVSLRIKYTTRTCTTQPCERTIWLLSYESDDGTLEPHPWEPEVYNVSRRFGYNRDEGPEVFKTTTDEYSLIEPGGLTLTKRGVFFAFLDEGSCTAIFSVKIYAIYCPEVEINFARFPRTPVGSDSAISVKVNGTCVENAVEELEKPLMYCDPNGLWRKTPRRGCRCREGFEPQVDQQLCIPAKQNQTEKFDEEATTVGFSESTTDGFSESTTDGFSESTTDGFSEATTDGFSVS